MELGDYQQQARKTEKKVYAEGADAIVPILGLAGEVGELLNEYKKRLRDGESHLRFVDRVAEELGDVLWYVAATATKFGLDLDDVAQRNLDKTRARWGGADEEGLLFDTHAHRFDDRFPPDEQLPRHFIAEFRQGIEGETPRTNVLVDGRQMGDSLTDNAHRPDGYRFHDVFHLACAAVLGWSPVIRKHLGRKRRSDPKVDEVEDGGRAIVTEEGISALVFAYAADHNALEGVLAVEYDLLKAIRIMTSSFEVSLCTTGEWERAILMGYQVWKAVEKQQGGRVELDLDRRTIRFVGPILLP